MAAGAWQQPQVTIVVEHDAAELMASQADAPVVASSSPAIVAKATKTERRWWRAKFIVGLSGTSVVLFTVL